MISFIDAPDRSDLTVSGVDRQRLKDVFDAAIINGNKDDAVKILRFAGASIEAAEQLVDELIAYHKSPYVRVTVGFHRQ